MLILHAIFVRQHIPAGMFCQAVCRKSDRKKLGERWCESGSSSVVALSVSGSKSETLIQARHPKDGVEILP